LHESCKRGDSTIVGGAAAAKSGVSAPSVVLHSGSRPCGLSFALLGERTRGAGCPASGCNPGYRRSLTREWLRSLSDRNIYARNVVRSARLRKMIRKVSCRMKITIALVAASLVTGIIGAHAQDIEGIYSGVASPKGHSTRHNAHRRSANNDGEVIAQPDIPRGSAGGPLPNHFRNCEKPTSRRYCAK
jgi:hypothetical protein